ncbi:hypothetical protein PHYSODRAFT_488366 [Phytophthora sojae]|uniref:RNase H type-1 domain-containing protein n=1 Tax=Phytophthora sojae (strain P6497) TaxID=1094619 RepID=G4Z984_PHYSP|nr:hypothetical protein PHYSODRAFT_488366 [Phytophthora sojae]EGZ21138.1 hypothetical protein PHYSODRAFT_488366 [Phytophthora sojae]|eukprot:XP_009523855.1 hypothetical protein PHYSODRAFT_488366 [Phytophthora sojae]
MGAILTRRLADKLCVLTWQHHLRAYNTMADTLANMAMDSVQMTITRDVISADKWQHASQHAASDIGHWFERTTDESSSELVAVTL